MLRAPPNERPGRSMISQTSLFILGGCLLGAIQLIAGIALGAWLRRPETADARHGRQDMIRSQAIAKRLQDLADEMSSSVGEHRSQLDQASRLLTSEDGRSEESLAELVVDVIDDIVRANQSLQSKLETAESRLEEQAAEIEAHMSRSLTDPLTGLPNRREFDERLEERIAAWNRRGEVFSLVLLDVDHFKKVNDAHGHLTGDQVLAAIGRTLRGAVRREDAVARYGGEEFALLLPSTTLDQTAHVTEKVREAVAGVVVNHNGQSIAVAVSGGLAMIEPNESGESLIQRADSALYSAKAAGRNCAFIHDGVEPRSVADYRSQPERPAGAADGLIDLINAPDAHNPPADESSGDGANGFGSYLPREAISAELAQTCEELRRFVETRVQLPQDAAPATGSR